MQSTRLHTRPMSVSETRRPPVLSEKTCRHSSVKYPRGYLFPGASGEIPDYKKEGF